MPGIAADRLYLGEDLIYEAGASDTNRPAFIGVGALVEVDAGNLTVSSPSQTTVGDTMLALVFHRLGVGQVPSGWTLVREQICNVGLNQYVAIWKRTATAADVTSFTLFTGMAGRGAAQIVVVRGGNTVAGLTGMTATTSVSRWTGTNYGTVGRMVFIAASDQSSNGPGAYATDSGTTSAMLLASGARLGTMLCWGGRLFTLTGQGGAFAWGSVGVEVY